MSKAVEILGLTKWYGDILAVDHLNLEVKEGEIFGFLGPNGAGKTTTIKMLTGLVKPSEGTAKIFGFEISKEARDAKRNMGIVWEESNIYPELSAWENLMFSGEIYHVGKKERQARGVDLLKKFGLYDRRNDKVGGFSKGMKRRVAISMALMNRPRLLFLDEPTTGLDVQSSIVIREAIREENKNGTTVFLTTHNLEEANLMCDRVAIINKGKIITIGSPENLKRTMVKAQSILVSFGISNQQIGEDLTKIIAVNKVMKEGDKFRLFTEDPPTVLESVWEFARKKGLKIISINTVGPSLEDVFLFLTGAGHGG
ncbi:MAG: ATP-binding cassette domain-containing protein [Candidatus Methanomethylicia archaeon]|jgi:ABC-2 type transport system ATP-binding protein|nr:ATP-binding cassette domain-containing protein [Candidatus Methanomethylicia archaeon]MCQ5373805.1 ATP-binding cassette domain-containing protein [Candidatus Methanomethylicia archaeon]